MKTWRGAIKAFKPAPNAVWLQDIGWVLGMPAKDVKPGMYRFYNYGSSSKVVRVEAKKDSIYITVDSSGKEWTRRSNMESIVPVQEVA